MAEDMKKIEPAVGDVMLVDGIERKILSIKDNKVMFGNPDDAPQFGKAVKSADGAIERERLNPSRAGYCATAELRKLATVKGANIWYLEGRLETKKDKPEAVKLKTADRAINASIKKK